MTHRQQGRNQRRDKPTPHYPRANFQLGGVLRSGQRNDDTAAHQGRALLSMPNSAATLNNLGNSLAALGRHDEAVARYAQALAQAPGMAVLHHNLANAFEALDRTNEALVHYERALALDPEFVDARLGMANVLRQLGRFDAANRAFETVIRSNPRTIAAYYGLGVSKRFAADDPYLAALEAFAREPASLSEESRVYLYFALGKACEDLGQHERSFAHFLEGNRLKRRQFAYDEAKVLGFMDGCRDIFTPGFFRTMAGHGAPSPVPVFIVGMPRSGSTLVEQILASHKQVFGGGERAYFEQSLTAARQESRTRTPQAGLNADRTDDNAWIGALATGYLRALTAAAPTALRITDKLLGNFNYIGLIHLALPNARIIHVSRDPLDTCVSCFSKLFSAPASFAYDLAEIGRYYRHYEQLMAHWRSVLPEGVMIDVRYEEVIDDLEGQARRIIAHCGLEWDDACLSFHHTERVVRTASVAQVRQPLYASSIGRARLLEAMLRPLMDALAGNAVSVPVAA